MSIYGHMEEEIERRSFVARGLSEIAHSSFMSKLFKEPAKVLKLDPAKFSNRDKKTGTEN